MVNPLSVGKRHQSSHRQLLPGLVAPWLLPPPSSVQGADWLRNLWKTRVTAPTVGGLQDGCARSHAVQGQCCGCGDLIFLFHWFKSIRNVLQKPFSKQYLRLRNNLRNSVKKTLTIANMFTLFCGEHGLADRPQTFAEDWRFSAIRKNGFDFCVLAVRLSQYIHSFTLF